MKLHHELLKISSNKAFILFALIPPLYSIWLLAIGQKLNSINRNKGKLFNAIATINVINNFLLIVLVIIIKTLDYDIKTEIKMTRPFLVYMYVFWFSTLAFISYLSVKFERAKNAEQYYGLRDAGDYLKCFFGFFFWPFFIWNYQPEINKY